MERYVGWERHWKSGNGARVENAVGGVDGSAAGGAVGQSLQRCCNIGGTGRIYRNVEGDITLT